MHSHHTLTSRSPIVASFKKTTPVILLSAALLFSSCTAQDTSTIEATNVLQNVDIALTDAAEVSNIDSTVISFNASTGQSSTENQTYTLRDVVNQLPVRITTRYTTEETAGNDLSDLEGYTGDVSINITVENLTVQPETLTYDVAGTQKSKSTLVGAPLSVAASTTLTGVKPHKVLSEATLGGGSTNGIISTNQNGDAVVQWGKILAGPGNSSTATFTVNLKAEDLDVPEFAVAVHPGLTNDLTAAGAVNSSFSDSQNSTMELMQQTVEVVTEANQALADAGATISKIRTSLNSSADSLKSSTIQELQQSSDKLTGQLSDLQEKLANLRTNLDESAQGSQDELINQMQQTLESLENFLGRQDEEIPAPIFDAQTCHISIAQPENGSTVYSNMVQLSSALGAYSEANIDCRDQVLGVLNTMLGPENPTAETCQGQAAASASCSIYSSKAVLDANLVRYAQETSEELKGLMPGALTQVRTDYETANTALQDLQARIDALPSDTPEPTEDPTSPTETAEAAPSPSNSNSSPSKEELTQKLEEINTQIQSSDNNLVILEDILGEIHTTSTTALEELSKNTEKTGSMLDQNQQLADQLCMLANQNSSQDNKLSLEQVNELRSYLTDTPCEASATVAPEPTENPQASPTNETTSDPNATSSLAPSDTVNSPATETTNSLLEAPEGYSAPMKTRLENQVELWSKVRAVTDTSSEESKTAQIIYDIRSSHQQVKDQVTTLLASLNQTPSPDDSPSATASPESPAESESPAPVPSETPVVTDVQAVKDAMPELTANFNSLNTSLDELATQQAALNVALQEIFDQLPSQNADEITELLNAQTRNIGSQRNESNQAITELFNQQVTNLTGTANALNTSADALIQEQGDRLTDAAQRQVEQADARTQSALERIQESHEAATQDVAAASTILTSELENIMLDIGDTTLIGSGLLGSLENNASTAGNADYQLSLATQNAEKYAIIREEDMGAIRLKQAQYTASLRKLSGLPDLNLSAPSGATVKTIYTFTIGSEE